MGKLIEFLGNFGDRQPKRNVEARSMQDGKFYDFNPPVKIGEELYDKVQCEYQVPNHPNEYVVRGIPRGSTEVKSMVLRFTATRGTRVTESATQDFIQE